MNWECTSFARGGRSTMAVGDLEGLVRSSLG